MTSLVSDMFNFLPEGFPEDRLTQPRCGVKVGKDVLVRMRDGVTVAVDIFRPAADLEVTGPFRFLLYASSSEKDADFYIRVVDQAPDAEQLSALLGEVGSTIRRV